MENADEWRPRLKLVVDRIQALEDSTRLLHDSIQFMERQISGEVAPGVTVIVTPATQASLRRRVYRAERDLEEMMESKDRLQGERDFLSHGIKNVVLCPRRPVGVR